VLETRKRVLGEEHPDSLTNLATRVDVHKPGADGMRQRVACIGGEDEKKRCLARTIPTCSSVWTTSR